MLVSPTCSPGQHLRNLQRNMAQISGFGLFRRRKTRSIFSTNSYLSLKRETKRTGYGYGKWDKKETHRKERKSNTVASTAEEMNGMHFVSPFWVLDPSNLEESQTTQIAICAQRKVRCKYVQDCCAGICRILHSQRLNVSYWSSLLYNIQVWCISNYHDMSVP